jgi:DnaJ family protein C protein 2
MGDAFVNICTRFATGDLGGFESVMKKKEVVDDIPADFLTKEVDLEDYYAVLGLEKGAESSPEEAKAAYRKLIMKFHPDKANNAQAEDFGGTDPRFTAMQKAVDTITNLEKRRAYDSHYKFDDAIPSAEKALASKGSWPKFFALFDPVFARNARFSEVQPVPMLGGEDATRAEVNAFYEFWHKFNSWRDFAKFCEHKPDQAEGRDQKRFMLAENKNLMAKKKKEEYARLTKLVSSAQKNDPRLIKFDEDEKAEKERKIKEKKDKEEAERKAKEDAENAAKKAAEDDAAAKKAAADKAKEDKLKAKKQIKKLTKSLKSLSEAAAAKKGPGHELISDANLDILLERASLEEIEGFVAGLSAAEPVAVEGLKAVTDYIGVFVAEQKAEEERKAEEKRAAAEAEAAKEEKIRNKNPWSEEENNLLIKATKKFPGGTRNRWEEIAKAVNTLGLPHSRNAQECTLQSKWIENNMGKK